MSQLFTREEVGRRTATDNVAIIIDNVVYGVTGWLDDHPGGMEVLMANAGKDASQCFHDIGHSEEAKLLRTKFKIGELVAEDRREVLKARPLPSALGPEPAAPGLLNAVGPPLGLGIIATLVYWYLFL